MNFNVIFDWVRRRPDGQLIYNTYFFREGNPQTQTDTGTEANSSTSLVREGTTQSDTQTQTQAQRQTHVERSKDAIYATDSQLLKSDKHLQLMKNGTVPITVVGR